MNYLELFAAAGSQPLRAALAGVGEFGYTLLHRARRIPGFSVIALADRDTARVAQALERLGYREDEWRACDSAGAAANAIARGRIAVCADGALLAELPHDILIEATGDAEAGARHALAAIAAGRHVAMVTKETDSAVGPILARRARAAGVVYTPVDGDQPALLIGLVSWARLLGLPIVAAGKSSEYDFIFDPATETVAWKEKRVRVPGFDRLWDAGGGSLPALATARAEALRELPRRIVPDYCEMCVVANATGLRPDLPELHVPHARTPELPRWYAPREHGGLIGQRGALDVFQCLRRPDEASFAGGVFVCVALEDAGAAELLAGKGIPVSADRRYAVIYNPSHLLGVEAPVSILAAARLGRSVLDESVRPVCDMVAVASEPLRAGTRLEMVGTRHTLRALEARLADAAPVAPEAPVPYYMLAGARLVKDVALGAPVTHGAIAAPADSVLWKLRAEQDAAFG
jgi:predicted homoserine dehydrogenase-like protein